MADEIARLRKQITELQSSRWVPSGGAVAEGDTKQMILEYEVRVRACSLLLDHVVLRCLHASFPNLGNAGCAACVRMLLDAECA